MKLYYAFSVLMLSCIVFSATSCHSPNMDFYIFSDITECESITQLNYQNSEVIKYDTPINDEYVKELTYLNSYAAQYSSTTLQFELYAYEFESAEVAKQYFQNATGKNDGKSTTFLLSSGIKKSELVVIDENRAYFAFTSRTQTGEMRKALSEIFSVKLNTSSQL